jgi:transposase
MKTSKRYSLEVRKRAVTMVFEHQGDYESQWSATGPILELRWIGK